MEKKIIVTNDGSHSIFVPELNEHYHSSFGALSESLHIFIRAGLDAIRHKFPSINLLEIGFGTGLNMLLTCLNACDSLIKYTGLEAYPLDFETIQQLNYPELAKEKNAATLFEKIHEIDWEIPSNITKNITLTKQKCFLETANFSENQFHLIYFDAFAPDVQPELWTQAVFLKLHKSLVSGGMLVTYSSKGLVKQNLRSAGFTIERLAGPPGKRHILRAWKS